MPYNRALWLGEPRIGIHRWRIPWVDIAAVDVIGTLIVSLLVAYHLRPPRNLFGSTVVCFGLLWAVGTALHVWFGVDTPVVRTLLHRNTMVTS